MQAILSTFQTLLSKLLVYRQENFGFLYGSKDAQLCQYA